MGFDIVTVAALCCTRFVKYASVYARPRSHSWYISYVDATTGRRIHRASAHRTDDPSGKRRAYDEAQQLSKAARAAMPSAAAESWESWVPGWMALHYGPRPKTLQRYETAWSHVFEFLQQKSVLVPRAIRYSHAGDFLAWRTAQRRRRGTTINYNTALTELKVLSTVMRESVRRGYADGNPLAQLGLRRQNVREKPEMTDPEIAQIREALTKEPEWMRDCFEVAIHTGCRLSETSTPLRQIDLRAGTITFRGKGSRIFTTLLPDGLRPIVQRRIAVKARNLVDLPPLPAKAWHSFFQKIGLGHLSFHSTRVTVITRLARGGVAQGIAQSFVGHATETVHRVYQRLTVQDLKPALNALAAIHAMPATPDASAPRSRSGPASYRARHQTEN